MALSSVECSVAVESAAPSQPLPSTATSTPAEYSLFVRAPRGSMHVIRATRSTTGEDVLAHLRSAAVAQRLPLRERRALRRAALCMRSGKYLEGARPLSEQGVEPGCTIDAVDRVRGGCIPYVGCYVPCCCC